MEAGQRDAARADREADVLGDLGDDADRREFVLMAGNEHDALVRADFNGQRDAHAWEHDRVFERDQSQQAHKASAPRFACKS